MTLPRTPSFRLDGKRALVTGAGRGIGLAIAAALAEAGAHVTLCARTTAEIDAAVTQITALGHAADALPLDITDLTAMGTALKTRAPYDILINNAGATCTKPMLEMTQADYDNVFGLNVRAAYFVAQAVAARLVATGKPGSIIHISSQMGHVGGIDRTLYAASKHAIEGLTKAMAIEFGKHRIRVNSIAPTFIRTDMTAQTLDNPERLSWIMSKIKLDRLGQVEDLMGAAVYLASEASALVTGTSLKVDGGWTAG